MKELWSSQARTDYEDTIAYLLKRWTYKEALFFIEKTERLIALVKRHPNIGTVSAKRSMARKILITEHTTLFYSVEDKTIHILTLWNNFQDPKNLTF